jgi:hypothetical protein
MAGCLGVCRSLEEGEEECSLSKPGVDTSDLEGSLEMGTSGFTQPQGSGRPSGSELDSGGPHQSRQSQSGKDSGGLQACTFLRNAKRVEEERPMDYGKSRIWRSENEREVVLDVSNAVRRYGQMWKLPRVTYIETYDCSGVGEY